MAFAGALFPLAGASVALLGLLVLLLILVLILILILVLIFVLVILSHCQHLLFVPVYGFSVACRGRNIQKTAKNMLTSARLGATIP